MTPTNKLRFVPEALTFPELLETVPNDAYLTIPNETEREVRIIPVGRYCHNAAAELRRLYDLAYKYKWQVIDMLEVLKLIDGVTVEGGTINNMARAAVTRAEREKA